MSPRHSRTAARYGRATPVCSHRAPTHAAVGLALTAFATVLPAHVGAQASVPGADTTRRVAVVGVAWDSTANRPLAGVVVQLVNPRDPSISHSVAADSLGRWRIDAVAPGQWVVGFLDPTLDLLGIEPPLRGVTVTAPDSVARVDVWSPGPTTVRTLLCAGTGIRSGAGAVDSTGALVGVVRDAEHGTPQSNARVVVSWSELSIEHGLTRVPHRVPVPVRAGGAFAICGVPTDGTVTVSAEAPGMRSGLLELQVAPGGVLRRDLSLDSIPVTTVEGMATAVTARGRARLTGVVRDTAGAALAGVRLNVQGTDVASTSAADGTFALDSLPAGTWSLEARSVGWTPVRRPVDLTACHPTVVAVVMRDHVPKLAPVTVRGRASASLSGPLGDFYLRRRMGTGRFLTPEEIERLNPRETTDLFQPMTGMTVLRSTGSVRMMSPSGALACKPLVVVDGIARRGGADDIDDLVPAYLVVAVEVYRAVEIPPQYGGGCGAVVLWTGVRRTAR